MEHYKRTVGTALISGEYYEVRLCTLLFLRSMMYADRFKLAVNMRDAGLFDDIVFCFKDKKTKDEKTYLIQVKHKEKKRFIDKRSLCAMKGDFSLFKYFSSYLEVKRNFPQGKNVFVIYTNAQMKSTQGCVSTEADDLLSSRGKIVTFTEQSEEYCAFKQLEAYRSAIHEISDGKFTEAEIRNRLKEFEEFFPSRLLLRHLNDKEKFDKEMKEQTQQWEWKEWDEFMMSLKLYTEQSSLKDLEILVKSDLEKLCGTSKMFFELQDAVMSWWRGEGYYLTENASFWENILQYHASELMNIVSLKLAPVSGLKFQQTEYVPITKKVTHIICRGSTELSCLRVQQSLSGTKHMLIDKSVLQEHLKEVLFLWNHFHSLVVDGNSVEVETEIISQMSNALHMDEEKKIIFISDNADIMAIRFVELFSSMSYSDIFNMSQLTVESQDILLESEVHFQGVAVKLKTLVVDPEIVTADVTIELLKKEKLIRVGCQLPSVDYIYIPRTLLRKEIVSKKIFEMTGSDCIAFSGITLSEVTSLLPQETVVQEFTDVDKINVKCRYFIIDGISSFENLCKKFECVHWLEKEEQSFIWRRSKGDITGIKSNLEQSSSIITYKSICEVLEIPEQLVLLIGDPGLGKTTEIAHLARLWKERNPSTWVLEVDLSHHTQIFSQDTITAVQLLCEAGNFETIFEKSLFVRELLERGNVLILMDGFDEISPYYSEKVIAIVKEIMCTKNSKICITSRPTMQDKLEKEFSTLAFSLNNFSRENQIEFLERMFRASVDGSADMRKFAADLLNLYDESLNYGRGNFTGTPLYCKMLFQVFHQKALIYSVSGDVLLPFRVDILKLYNEFVDLKLEVFFEKCHLNLGNFSVYSMAQQMKKKWIQDMTVCALFSFLTDDDFAILSNASELRKRYCSFLENFKQDMERTGLIVDIVQDKPVFINRSFVEYFVARWLSENYYENQKLILSKLFDSNWQIVKAFLDRILCVTFSLHTAVLYQDLPEVQHLLDLEKVDVNEKDRGGRTALHLAVTTQNKAKHEILEKILMMLLDHGADPNIEDGLFKWRPLRFAEKAKLWFAIEILIERGADKSDLDAIKDNFDNYEYINDILNSSILGGMKHILQFLLTVCDDDGNTLLHHVVEKFSEDVTGVMMMLLQHGANVDVKNKQMQTPLHLAVKHGKLNIVTLLLQYRADISCRDVNGMNAMDYAVKYNAQHIVDLLKELDVTTVLHHELPEEKP